LHRRGWWAALKRALGQFKHDDITDRAAALTYIGVLALFPGLLVLVAALGLMGESTTQKVRDKLGQIAPGGVKTFLKTVIRVKNDGHGARRARR
jgi:membrane protein